MIPPSTGRNNTCRHTNFLLVWKMHKFFLFWPPIWNELNVCAQLSTHTLFENYSKCRIWIFEFWHFSPIFVLLKLTCLVTLFDRKLQVFKNSPKWTIFGIFNLFLSIQNVNVARFARNVEWAFFFDFQPLWKRLPSGHIENWVHFFTTDTGWPEIFWAKKKSKTLFDSKVNLIQNPIWLKS